MLTCNHINMQMVNIHIKKFNLIRTKHKVKEPCRRIFTAAFSVKLKYWNEPQLPSTENS